MLSSWRRTTALESRTCVDQGCAGVRSSVRATQYRHPLMHLGGLRAVLSIRPRAVGELPIEPISPTTRLTTASSRSRSLLFFFQAEDGIRDIGVTGVQTCALPI